MINVGAAIAPFWGFMQGTPALPEFYWDVYSAEQRWKTICCIVHRLTEYANLLGDNINNDHKAIQELQDLFTKFMESGFDDYYEQQVLAWIDSHMEMITQAMVFKSVYFGLTDDGYFCAYIPDSWDDITFDTGMVFGEVEYGRLILKY